MNARDKILRRLMPQGASPKNPAPRWPLPVITELAPAFIAKAVASYANVHETSNRDSIPDSVCAILNGASPRLHLPNGSRLWDLPWHRAPQLLLTAEPPTGDDTALSFADFGIAETGTLVFFSGPARPASWHFLPGREIALLSRADILASFEDVIARMGTAPSMPSTLNLVTGPSRTGDIEQTMEVGAHGPREIHIVLVP